MPTTAIGSSPIAMDDSDSGVMVPMPEFSMTMDKLDMVSLRFEVSLWLSQTNRNYIVLVYKRPKLRCFCIFRLYLDTN